MTDQRFSWMTTEQFMSPSRPNRPKRTGNGEGNGEGKKRAFPAWMNIPFGDTQFLFFSDVEPDENSNTPGFFRYLQLWMRNVRNRPVNIWDEQSPYPPEFDFEDDTHQQNDMSAGFIFNLSAYRALVKPGQPRTKTEQQYAENKFLREWDGFDGTMIWEMSPHRRANMMQLYEEITFEAQQDGKRPSLLPYLYQLNRTKTGDNNSTYTVMRIGLVSQMIGPAEREAVQEAFRNVGDMETLIQYVRRNIYDPANRAPTAAAPPTGVPSGNVPSGPERQTLVGTPAGRPIEVSTTSGQTSGNPFDTIEPDTGETEEEGTVVAAEEPPRTFDFGF